MLNRAKSGEKLCADNADKEEAGGAEHGGWQSHTSQRC